VPRSKTSENQAKKSGGMTVREAGRKGGEVTARRHGPQFYEEIGRKGGQKVKELIEQGKRAQEQG
jgi:general stress protein YciG